MKKYLLISIWFIGASCFATEQIKDVLSVGEARYSIRELPLNQLYDHDKLSSILNQELCSASWRGYKARWELKDNFLWLRGLEKNPCSNGHEAVEAKLLFGGQEYPIKAKWFTEKIVLPVGETKYVMREGFDENDMKDGDLLGYDLEAFVFNFVDGKLKSKGVELIQKRY